MQPYPLFDHIYIFSSLFLAIYSQLIMRWQVSMAGALPAELSGKIYFIFTLFLNPWVISALAATFLSGIAWMFAMTKFEISYAYPWMSLNFVLVMLFSFFFLGESLNMSKIIGSLLVVAGVIVLARGQ